MTLELMKCHQRPWSSWLSLLQILQIDLLAYTGLFSVFAGLAIFFILTWKTREFDLNFAFEKFYFLLNQLLVLCFDNENALSKVVNTVGQTEFAKRYLQYFLATVPFYFLFSTWPFFNYIFSKKSPNKLQ